MFLWVCLVGVVTSQVNSGVMILVIESGLIWADGELATATHQKLQDLRVYTQIVH